MKKKKSNDKLRPLIKRLYPIKKTSATNQTHYVIATLVPNEWKDGVKITIEPSRGLHRLYGNPNLESDREFQEIIEKQLEEDEKNAEEFRRQLWRRQHPDEAERQRRERQQEINLRNKEQERKFFEDLEKSSKR